jgi:tripartite-type tricarboxylate transporter receptor subunit TctC
MRLAVLLISLCACVAAFAQSWPARPGRIIVPVAPGGPVDTSGRGIAQVLSDALGQSFVVENRPGADSIIGNEACARAPADGYTLCTSDGGGYSLNPVIRRSMPYDPLRDLAPVIMTGIFYQALVAHPSLPASTMAEVFALVKAKPGSISFGTAGPSSTSNIYVEWLKNARGLEFLNVPYKVQPQAATAVVAGETMLTTFVIGQAATLVKAGKVKALAQNTAGRSRLMPDVPSFKEAGIDVNLRVWLGLFAPAGTPREIVQRVHGVLLKNLINTPAARDKFLVGLGLEVEPPVGDTPEAFAAFLKEDREYYAGIVKAAGIKTVD